MHASCDCVEEVTIWADPDRVGQILSNLLANTARYCRPGDHVHVSVRTEADDGVLVVTDTGPGMDERDVQLAFDRFHRGRQPTDQPGSGLGLAIVRALADSQGGSVSLESALGAGTSVTVRLPRWTDQRPDDS